MKADRFEIDKAALPAPEDAACAITTARRPHRSAKGARAVTLFPLLATLAKARATLIVCKCSATARRPRRTAIMGKQGDRQDDRRRTGHVEDTPLAGRGRDRKSVG